MTEYGDIGGDIPTVLQAISEVSRDLSLKKPRYPATAWEALVEAGVVDALCACVADTKLLVNGSPASPKVPGSSAPSGMPSMPAPSPWAPALQILAYAAVAMNETPKLTDKSVIRALKMHWPTMVTRVR